MDIEIITIHTKYIKLDQFLKLINIINSGSDAKLMIASSKVSVNEKIEIRRGRKLISGDRISINGRHYIVKSESNNDSCF